MKLLLAVKFNLFTNCRVFFHTYFHIHESRPTVTVLVHVFRFVPCQMERQIRWVVGPANTRLDRETLCMRARTGSQTNTRNCANFKVVVNRDVWFTSL